MLIWYDALILADPYGLDVREQIPVDIQYTPTALILITVPMLLYPSYGYLLAIFLCAWLLIFVGSSMGDRSVATGGTQFCL